MDSKGSGRDATGHIPEFSGRLRRHRVDDLHVDRHRRPQPPLEALLDASDIGCLEERPRHDEHRGERGRLLDDLEGRHPRNIPKNINQRKAMHHGAIRGDDEIGAAALDFTENRQPATAGARIFAQDTDITRAIPHERVISRREVGHDDLARHARRLDPPFPVDDLDDDGQGGSKITLKEIRR